MTVWGLGVEEGMTKVALLGAFGGLGTKVAPAGITNLTNTAKNFKLHTNTTRKAVVKPPPTAQAKPMVVKTSVPQPPQIEPSTITPTQPSPAAKIVTAARKKKRDRTSSGEPRTGGEPQRPGEDMSMKHPAPGNNPVTYTNGKPHDF